RHGWQCSCSAHRADTRCSHIEQAQGLRRRRGEKREPDTIELELSAEQLRTLSEGLAAREEEPPPAAVAVPNVMRPVHRWDWTTWFLAVAVAVASSSVTYLMVKPGEPAGADTQPLTAFRIAEEPAPAPPPESDVRFVNPFDAREIFSFPAGTSETSAHQAVAALLLKRAQERLEAGDALRRSFSKAGDRSRHAPVLANLDAVKQP